MKAFSFCYATADHMKINEQTVEWTGSLAASLLLVNFMSAPSRKVIVRLL